MKTKPSIISIAAAISVGAGGIAFGQSDDRNDKTERIGAVKVPSAEESRAEHKGSAKFTGRIVSLNKYLQEGSDSPNKWKGSEQSKNNPSRAAKRSDTSPDVEEVDDGPFGLIATSGDATDSTTASEPKGESKAPSDAAKAGEDKLSVLIIDESDPILMAKVRKICEEHDRDSKPAAVNESSRTIADAPDVDTEVEAEAEVDNDGTAAREVNPTVNDTGAYTAGSEVTVTGRRVSRDGLSAILVDDIELKSASRTATRRKTASAN